MLRRAVVLTICFVLVAGSPFAKACTLTFAVSNAFPPHHIQNSPTAWSGVVMDLFHQLAQGAGCEVEVVNVPWDRTIDLLEQGRIDAVSILTKSAERAAFTHFIGPHYMERIVVIANKEIAPQLVEPEDLLSFPGLIGKTRGTYYGPGLERMMAQPALTPKLVDLVENTSRINMLKAKRIDAIFEEASVADYLFNERQLDREQHLVTLTFSNSPVYFGFSKKSTDPQRLSALQASWTKMLEDDALRKAHQKYQIEYVPVITDQD